MSITKSWLFPLIALGLVGCSLISKSKGDKETQTTPHFDAIIVRGIGTLSLTQGENSSFRVDASQAILGQIKTSVRNNTLEIDSLAVGSGGAPIFHVTVKNLQSLELDGAAEAEMVTPFHVNSLFAKLKGAGGMRLLLDGTSLVVDVAGTGNIVVEGQIEEQTVQIEGLGHYDAEQLKSRDAIVRVSGAGVVTLDVSDNLVVSVSGGAKVYYVGSPHITRSISGAGVIQKLEEKKKSPRKTEVTGKFQEKTPLEKQEEAIRWEPHGASTQQMVPAKKPR
ncbi:MAG: DUF2807 domain-containing protein [Verrucomicrobia bacterium]|nr:DUF2807 domain-containing protein [Verrucomicrobiota bacterium]